MISLDKFKHYMNTLKEFEDIEKDIDRALNRLSPDFGGFYLGKIKEEYLNMLRELVNDKYDDIEYYIYDLEWGSEWHKGTITDEHNNDIRLATIEDLYNYIRSEQDE